MNNQNNKKKNSASQMKTIYITLALSLTIMAVLTVLSGVWRQSVNNNDPMITTDVMMNEADKQVMAQQNSDKTTAVTDSVIESSVAVTENFEDELHNETTENVIADEPLPDFIAPVSGYVMKGHSMDLPVFSITMNDYRPHTGVDLYANAGDDVFAAASGVIADVWEDPLEGFCISIEHSGGAVSIYKNLDPTLPNSVSSGVEVKAGEVIATVGDSSMVEIAEEAHLHYELEIDGEQVDPTMYIAFPEGDTEYEG